MMHVTARVASPENTISSHAARSNSCTGGSDAGKITRYPNYNLHQIGQGAITNFQVDHKVGQRLNSIDYASVSSKLKPVTKNSVISPRDSNRVKFDIQPEEYRSQ